MHKILVAGIGTDVGKTLVSAILTILLKGDYWKPIQCGPEEHGDTAIIKQLLDNECTIHAPAYSFKAPLSPHHAARLENAIIDLRAIEPPSSARPLIIEGVGGIHVPLTAAVSSLDLFTSWNCRWVIVSRHYLGSINHTLLTAEVLKTRGIPILGIVFNGDINPDSEAAILNMTQLPMLGRLLPESDINPNTLHRYSQQWQAEIYKHLH